MKKYFAEAVGTMVLVLMGCGVAVSLNCTSDCSTVANAASVIGTAFAFGLAVVAMAYTIGGISGCHINPAITVGCLLSGRISGKDAVGYICGQIVGAFIGSAILFALTSNVAGLDATGANEWRHMGWWPHRRDRIYLRLRTCRFRSHLQDQRCHQQLRWSRDRSLAGSRPSGMHPLYGHLCQSCPQSGSRHLPRRHSPQQLMDFHRGSLRWCRPRRWHLEGHRA